MRSPLKTILFSALATVGAFVSVVYLSCNRDKCKTIVCANGGVCDGGACQCKSGYQGSNCETVSRNKFLGNWTVFEKGNRTQAAQYDISIVTGTDITDLYIRNFYNYFRTPIKAVVRGNHGDTLVIPNQQYEGKTVFGIGYIASNATYGQYGTITMRYEIIDSVTHLVNDFGYYYPDASDPSQWNK